MSDFHQHGLICTLQHLAKTDVEKIEAALASLARDRPVSLVLPCHYPELGRPALARILDEISRVDFLREVIVSMNGMDSAGFRAARDYFSRVRQPCRILWNDGPHLGVVYKQLEEMDAAGIEQGKGFNVWAAVSLICAEGISEIVVTQDCDVASFRGEMLLRLCFASLDPELDYEYSKMYYSRVTDRIYGRVSRLFLTPLLRALARVVGHHPLLNFLLSFRYPLSGEYAIRRDLAASIPLRSDWGLEIGLLCEIFRHAEPNRVCQVDGGGNYDHKHQPLDADTGGGLRGMSRRIAQALLGHLADEGVVVTGTFGQAVRASYHRESREALRRGKHLALINGLAFDDTAEGDAIELFSTSLSEAMSDRAAPLATLPSWKRVQTLLPGFSGQFLAAVAADNS